MTTFPGGDARASLKQERAAHHARIGRAAYEAWRRGPGAGLTTLPWDCLQDRERAGWADVARASRGMR